MPKETNESTKSPTTKRAVATSDVASDSGNEPNTDAPASVPDDAVTPAEPEGEGLETSDGGTPSSDLPTTTSVVGQDDNGTDVSAPVEPSDTVASDESNAPVEHKLEDVSDEAPELNHVLEEVSDPMPEAPVSIPIASSFPEGSVFAPYTTPDGTVFNIKVENGRFDASNDDGTNRVASLPTNTIDEFYAFLNEQNPAKVDPFTGQDAATRVAQGIQGADPTTPIEAPEPVVSPTVPVHLDYSAFINNQSWFPTAINALGGLIVDNSDYKTVHVLLHDAADFRDEWAHLLKKEVDEVKAEVGA